MVDVDLKTPIQIVFNLQPFQVEGPGWLTSEFFDVTATFSLPPHQAAPAPGSPDVVRLSRLEVAELQPWLMNQFKLKYHKVARNLPAYALVVAKGGAKLTPAVGRCGYGTVGGNANLVDMELHSTMKDFATQLGLNRQHMVVDETGLTGCYDIKLQFARTSINPTVDPSSINPSLFTALAQIGLKLEALTVPTEVLIIDQANRVPLGN